MKVISKRTLFLKNREKLFLGQILIGKLEDFSAHIQKLIKEKSPFLEVIEDAPEPKKVVVEEPKKVAVKKVVKKVEPKKVAKLKKLVKKSKK